MINLFLASRALAILIILMSSSNAWSQGEVSPIEWPVDTPRPIATPTASTIGEALEKRPIVRATVEEQIVELGGRIITSQRIEHVYCGHKEMLGRSFKDISVGASFQGGRRGTYYLVTPMLEVGEVGIWMLVPFEDLWFREAEQSLGTWWPARPNVSPPFGPDHEGVRQLAEAMEIVWKAESEADRVELVEQFARSGTPEVAVGAIMLLAECASDTLVDFGRQQDLQALPLRAQIVLDEAMSKFHPEWKESDRRNLLLEAWQERVMANQADALAVLTRLDLAIQRNEIDAEQLYEFLKGLATTGDASSEVRLRAVTMLRWIISDENVGDEVFDLLAGILKDGGSRRLEQNAAYAISPVEKLNDERMARLILLRDAYLEKSLEIEDARDPIKRIATTLDETVRRLQKPKRPGDAKP